MADTLAEPTGSSALPDLASGSENGATPTTPAFNVIHKEVEGVIYSDVCYVLWICCLFTR